eukprot:jgi/Chrzof1/237/Cz01g08100.t1
MPMDVAQLIANRPLLSQLSQEYEHLKRSGAAVDYDAWIKDRLAQAAAAAASQHNSPFISAQPTTQPMQGHYQHEQAQVPVISDACNQPHTSQMLSHMSCMQAQQQQQQRRPAEGASGGTEAGPEATPTFFRNPSITHMKTAGSDWQVGMKLMYGGTSH